MKKDFIITGLVGLAIGIGVMWFFGDKIKGMIYGYKEAPAKAK